MLASGLTTQAKVILGLVAFAFIAFALISSFVLPRRNPDFPGKKGLRTYLIVAVLFFVAMITTVIVVAKEPKESAAASTTPPPPSGPSAAAVAAGKKVFATAGCVSCHTLKDAGATGKVGPDLDQLKPDAARVARQLVHPKKAMPSFKGTLSAAQIAAVAAYVAAVAGKP